MRVLGEKWKVKSGKWVLGEKWKALIVALARGSGAI